MPASRFGNYRAQISGFFAARQSGDDSATPDGGAIGESNPLYAFGNRRSDNGLFVGKCGPDRFDLADKFRLGNGSAHNHWRIPLTLASVCAATTGGQCKHQSHKPGTAKRHSEYLL
ncbi:MAG: hypothetical protein ACI9TB_002321 [Parasphingorhabdus sp.]